MSTMTDPVRAAVDAAFPGLPACMTMEEAERRVRAAIAAYLDALTGAVLEDAD